MDERLPLPTITLKPRHHIDDLKTEEYPFCFPSFSLKVDWMERDDYIKWITV